MRDVTAIVNDLSQRDLLELATMIARRHKVRLDELLSGVRTAPTSRARHELWLEMVEPTGAEHMGLSHACVGRIFGADHTSVLYGVARARASRAATKTKATSAQVAAVREEAAE